jgi:ankyrin repeat protein
MRIERDHSLPAAVLDGDLVRSEELLRAGADPNRKDPLGYPPLQLAAARGQVQMVELLLTAGADPLLLDTRMGASALHKAAIGGVVEVARVLLDHGAFVNQRAPLDGQTPLFDAVLYKHLPMVKYLLDRGADPDLGALGGIAPGDLEPLFLGDDFSPYREAIEQSRRDRAERADDPLRLAALEGDATRVRELIEAGAAVDRIALDGNTPLLDAARLGHADVVRVLLEAGADPRVVDQGNMKATPAHKAGYMGHADVAHLLVADPRLELDAQGPFNGYTALHDAIWHGHLETARVYVEAGARLNLRALDGRTPVEMARDYGYPEIVDMLEEALRADESPSL